MLVGSVLLPFDADHTGNGPCGELCRVARIDKEQATKMPCALSAQRLFQVLNETDCLMRCRFIWKKDESGRQALNAIE